jgi:cytochrome c-type biogenesis protein CcmH
MMTCTPHGPPHRCHPGPCAQDPLGRYGNAKNRTPSVDASSLVDDVSVARWVLGTSPRMTPVGVFACSIRWILRCAVAPLLLCLCLATSALAVEPDEILADGRLEARARHLSTGLRCLVCQNQSIDDSSAPLARDLRLLVRERLTAGETDAQVMRFITDRYGQFVLLNPPVGRNTLLLWATPILLLAAAALYWWRRREPVTAASPATPVPLSSAEQQRLDKLISKQKADRT